MKRASIAHARRSENFMPHAIHCLYRALVPTGALFLLVGCETDKVQPQAAQAKAETPVVAKVE